VRSLREAWRGSREEIEKIAARMLAHAGLEGVRATIAPSTLDDEQEELPCTHDMATVTLVCATADACELRYSSHAARHPALLAGALAHAIAHVARTRRGLTRGPDVLAAGYRALPKDVSDEGLEEVLTDVTSVVLGFGVLATNGSDFHETTNDRGVYRVDLFR